MARSQKSFINSHQPNVRKISAHIDGTGTASVTTGKNQVTLTDNGTGDYTITLTYPPKQILGLQVTPITKCLIHVPTITNTTSFVVKAFDPTNLANAIDAKFFVEVLASDSAYDF